MVRYKVHEEFEPALMETGDQIVEVVKIAKNWVNVFEVLDVVAVIFLG